MKRKFLLGIIAAIALMTFVSAAIYVEPWNTDVNAGGYDISNVGNITANNFLGNLSGNLDWDNLENFPVACPGSSAITQLDDSVTCSDLWFNLAGNETITGNMTFSNEAGILNLSFIKSLDWTNVTLTESQITDLQNYLVNGTDGWTLNFSEIFSLDWSNVTITESQITDLDHNINGTNINVLDINGSSMTLNGDLNMSAGNLTLMDKITFRFLEVIDNLVDGWITITGNLQVNGDTNMTGNLNVSGHVDVGGNFTGNYYYGEMWMHNESGYVTTPIASSLVWYNLTGFNDSTRETGQTLNGFTYDNAAEHLTALVAGKYKAIFSVSKGNAGNNQEYQFAVAINDVIQNNTVIHRKLGTGGDVGDTAVGGFIDIVVNDNIHLMTLNKDGTADIQTHAMNLNLVRIGE